MKLSEAKAIRAEIVELRKHAPAYKGARRISRDIMRALNNEREDAAAVLHCTTGELAPDYEISEEYAEKMRAALERAKKEAAAEK